MMKAISIWQPWASLIVSGYKKFETRNWKTSHRGKLIIHAAKRKPKKEELEAIAQNTGLTFSLDKDFFLGKALAIVDLIDCHLMTDELIEQQSKLELSCGNWQKGRYAWQLQLSAEFNEPIPAQGKQQLWDFPSFYDSLLEEN
jgi:hypothetical protein